ncbi:MAG: P1 family peptidase [Deltaproteobacteria bacterium]|jgi:L-aminopeptidase/D-esterase-like protein|nr:P1 family peptidase [Deltaproteobacteria bacterium]
MKEIGISEVDGFSVGHCVDAAQATGCTVILCPEGAAASSYSPGFAPGSHELEALRPTALVDRINGLLFSGGSAYGLGAVTGVVEYLREQGKGFDTGGIKVPIVPAAVIYDYPQNRSQGRLPDAKMGYDAAKWANNEPLLSGPYGAGVSAAAGKLGGLSLESPSGIGVSGVQLDSGLQLAVLAVVNPSGSVIDIETGKIVSGLRKKDGTLAGKDDILNYLSQLEANNFPANRGATVLIAVATNSPLNKVGAYRLARMAACGIARAIYPAHLLFDGDIVLALSSGKGPVVSPNYLGAMGAELVAKAIVNSVPGA